MDSAQKIAFREPNKMNSLERPREFCRWVTLDFGQLKDGFIK
jgi:hypothetical protein